MLMSVSFNSQDLGQFKKVVVELLYPKKKDRLFSFEFFTSIIAAAIDKISSIGNMYLVFNAPCLCSWLSYGII